MSNLVLRTRTAKQLSSGSIYCWTCDECIEVGSTYFVASHEDLPSDNYPSAVCYFDICVHCAADIKTLMGKLNLDLKKTVVSWYYSLIR